MYISNWPISCLSLMATNWFAILPIVLIFWRRTSFFFFFSVEGSSSSSNSSFFGFDYWFSYSLISNEINRFLILLWCKYSRDWPAYAWPSHPQMEGTRWIRPWSWEASKDAELSWTDECSSILCPYFRTENNDDSTLRNQKVEIYLEDSCLVAINIEIIWRRKQRDQNWETVLWVTLVHFIT